MLRTKRDVDRHVRELLSKVKNDSDRKSRGYSISRLYKNVGEYESARRYLTEFLAIRPKSSEAHRLLGDIYESLNQKEKAIISYKTSYELSDSQKELVLKICELYAEIPNENSAAIFWVDEGERLYPHHNKVLKLRESLMLNKSSYSNVDLEQLYLQEIRVNPLSLTLHIKLIKLYRDWSKEDKSKLEVAYNYVIKLETRRPFPHSLEWYQNVFCTFEAYETWKKPHRDKNFEQLYLSILDLYVHQSLAFSYGPALTAVCSTSEALNRLKKFDARLQSSISVIGKDSLCAQHMIHQYYFHLSTLLLILDSNESILNVDYFVGALLMHSIGAPKNQKIPSNSSDLDLIKNFWYSIGCHRVSQVGHILNELALRNGGENKFLDKVNEICNNNNGKTTLHGILFGTTSDPSFLSQDSDFGSNMNFVGQTLQLLCDQDSTLFCSLSLSELVWLFMHYDSSLSEVENKSEYSFFNFHIFRGIPFSSGVSTNAPESLSHLDLVAFIVATAYCQQANDSNFKAALSKPTSLCLYLHTSEQVEWWNAAVFLCKNSSSKRLNRLRSVLQNGLEGIRHLGHHVLPLPLTLYLARYFTSCVTAAKTDGNSSSEIEALEERAEHYWNKVLTQCKKSGQLSIVSSSKSRLFELPRSEVTDCEKDELEEEAQLFLADRMESKGRRQEAIRMLSTLKSPQASFKRAMLYKKEAKELVGNFSVNRLSIESRSEYISLLTQVRDTLYLTLDRLKMPEMNALSCLNQELSDELASVERSLATASYDDRETALNLDATNGFNLDSSNNDFQAPLELTNGNGSSFGHISSTPFRPHNSSSTGIVRQEARPSPERLDAQMRHLTEIQQNTIKNVEGHNAALRAQNEALLQTCQTMASDIKQHVAFYKKFIEQKNESENLSPVVNQLKDIQIGMKNLQIEVRALATEVAEIKAIKTMKTESTPPLHIHSVASVTENNVSVGMQSPAMQGMYNNYMSFYGQQPGGSPLIGPTALFKPPFAPPSTLSDPSYMPPNSTTVMKSETNNSVHSSGSPYHMMGSISTPMPSTSSMNLREALEAPRIPPHSFQITLPSSVSVSAPITTQFDSVSDINSSSPAFSTEGLLSNVPAPIYSAVVTSPDRNASLNILASAMSAPGAASVTTFEDSPINQSGFGFDASHNKSANDTVNLSDHYVDDGLDPCPDYKPVIPLPATVEVITGEEDETVLFEEKAKLYRYVDKEWRERGLGPLKILHNTKQGTTRILMRRDQTLKICCNHLISSSMELSLMKENDKAWLWAAQDFADEDLKLEKFCCRFKTVEIAQTFKESFNKAKEIAKSSVSKNSKLETALSSKSPSAATSLSLSDKFKPAKGSWECDACLLNNQPNTYECAACKTPNPNAKVPSASIVLVDSTTTPLPASTFKFGLSETTKSDSAATTSSPIMFGSITTKSSTAMFGSITTSSASSPSTFVFGAKPTTAPSILFGSSPSIVTTNASTFGLSSSITITPAKGPAPPSLFGDKASVDKKFSLEGFTFSSTPAVDDTAKVVIKPVEVAKTKESIFSGLSFKSVSPSTADTNTSSIFSIPVSTSKPSETTPIAGGLFSGASNSGPTLTFGSIASKPEDDSASIFKIKNDKAFTAKPLFGAFTKTTSQEKDSATTDDANASKEEVEEYEPEVDFKPVIPLPDLVEVKTGEEDEEKIFSERAKLFRYDGDTKEWKERGVGDMKLLKNTAANKVRVLMRRDQTHKVCANHFIHSEMKLTPMQSSDKAWVWGANDYADEEVKVEKFAVRFKTQEQALQFKTGFDEALLLKPTEETKVVTSSSKPVASSTGAGSLFDKFKPATGSWECDACLVMNKPTVETCASCQTVKPGCEASQAATVTSSSSEGFTAKPYTFGASSESGFSFGVPKTDSDSKPSATFSFGFPPSTPASNSVSFANDEAIVPFSATKPFEFKFNAGTEDSIDAVTPNSSGFAFGSPNKYEFSFSGVKPESVKSPRSRDVSVCESEDGYVEEEEDNLYFEPVVPLPEKIDVVTGEEDEAVLFTHRAKLFRMCQGEFKERGLGDVKILQHNKTNKIRLLMRREQVHKICLNHYVDLIMEFRKKDDKSFYWVATDFSENEPSKETFAIRFKTPEVAASFLSAIKDAQNILRDPSSVKVNNSEVVSTSTSEATPKSAFGMFGGKTTATPSPKSTFSFGNRFSSPTTTDSSKSDLLEVTFEKKATPDLIQKARNLQLPDNFYLYEQAEQCSGCRGCDPQDLPKGKQQQIQTTPEPASVVGSNALEKVKVNLFNSGSTASQTPVAPSLFGNIGKPIDSNSKSIFGSSSPSLFGPKSSTTSLFSSNSSSPTQISSSTATPPLIFGGNSQLSEPATTSSSIFGANPTSIFGAKPSPTSLFGGTPSSTSLFGGTPSSFGGTPSSTSLFGGTPKPTSLLGGKPTDSGTNGNTSLFGGPKPTTELMKPSLETTSILSTPESISSFGDVASSDTNFSFKSTKNVNNSAWVAKPLFGSANVSDAKSPNASQNNEEVDDYDPQFEPVIPMPDLVEVKTGEEGWQVLFSYRAKTYRFDSATKQWKERGIGEFKIQHEPSLKKYRLLQRREQVHKLSCNHYLTPTMKLDTMASSDVAWCWMANDFSEKSEGELLNLAVKFKTKEIATEFKEMFDKCQKELSTSVINTSTNEPKSTPAVASSTTKNTSASTSATPHYSDDENYVDSDDTDELEPSEMLTDYCILYKQVDQEWICLGEGEIRIFYDDDSYMARVMFHSTDEEETKLTDHLISIETTVFAEDSMSVSWNGLDETTDPQINIRFKAQFDTQQSAKAFEEILQEGKDFAYNCGLDEANIREVPQDDLYYGQAQEQD